MPERSEPPPTSAPKGHLWLLFALFTAGILLFSTLAGGFSSDLGGDPDEAAHAVTSLMLRDYAVDGLGQNPMTFAKKYYEDFPRVALGHYPPLYYCVAAPLLLLHTSVSTLLLLQAGTLGGLAVLTVVLGRRFLPSPLALAAGLGVSLLPVALKLTLHVMADVLLALLCLWAAWLWAAYLRTPSVRRALAWGCVAAAAILTKGSAMGLCLLPPLGTILVGRWRLAFQVSWWCAALPVAVLAGPWMLYSTKISKEGMTQLSPLQYLVEAVPFHLKAMPSVFGWPLALLFALAVVALLLSVRRKGGLPPEVAALAAMSMGMTAVLLLVPVGLSTRYMLTLAPAVLLGAAWALAQLPWPKTTVAAQPVFLLLLSMVPLFQGDVSLQKDVHGFSEAILRSGIPAAGQPRQSWLVTSDPRGEGALVGAAAFHSPQRSPSSLQVLRGTKALSTSDWMGRDYKAAAATEEEMLAHLDKLQVTRVFVDVSMPAEKRSPHEHLLQKALATAPSKWALDFEQPISRTSLIHGKLLVYKRL